jgi:hypothetical protein
MVSVRKTPALWAPVAAVVLLLGAQAGEAKGCLKGAAVGAVAGHVAGHHAVLGAAAGCVIGHHLAKKQEQRAQAKAAQSHAH